MAASAEIVVLGGGVIGLTTAYYLARAGARVAVVDKGAFGQEASWAGAGIISPGNPRRAHSPMGQLRARSAVLWPELSHDLLDHTGIKNGYHRCGGLELQRSEEALEKLRLEILLREERDEGARCEVLDRRGLQQLEPAVAESLPGAVYLPEMAQVRNPWHLRALTAACQALGVVLLPQHEIVGFDCVGGRVLAACSPDARFAGERFLIAAGAWSADLLRRLVVGVSIRPIRGQIVLYHVVPPVLRHILLAGSEYLVPREDGRILVGSTEEDVGFVKENTPSALDHLQGLAVRLVPRLASAAIEKSWSGLRPGSGDGRPFLGVVPGHANLFLAAGHFRSGLQNSPATGLVMKELLLGEPLSFSLEAFRVQRDAF